MYFDPYPITHYRNALKSTSLNASSGPIYPLKDEKHGATLTSYSIGLSRRAPSKKKTLTKTPKCHASNLYLLGARTAKTYTAKFPWSFHSKKVSLGLKSNFPVVNAQAVASIMPANGPSVAAMKPNFIKTTAF